MELFKVSAFHKHYRQRRRRYCCVASCQLFSDCVVCWRCMLALRTWVYLRFHAWALDPRISFFLNIKGTYFVQSVFTKWHAIVDVFSLFFNARIR